MIDIGNIFSIAGKSSLRNLIILDAHRKTTFIPNNDTFFFAIIFPEDEVPYTKKNKTRERRKIGKQSRASP